jgi:hypothetical protein
VELRLRFSVARLVTPENHTFYPPALLTSVSEEPIVPASSTELFDTNIDAVENQSISRNGRGHVTSLLIPWRAAGERN